MHTNDLRSETAQTVILRIRNGHETAEHERVSLPMAKDSPPAETVVPYVFLLWCFLADNVQFQDLTIQIFHQQYLAVWAAKFGRKFFPDGPVHKSCSGAAGVAGVERAAQAHGN